MSFVNELITAFLLIFGAGVLLGGLFSGVRKAIRKRRKARTPWQIWVHSVHTRKIDR